MTETPTRDDVARTLRSVKTADVHDRERRTFRYCPNCGVLPTDEWDGTRCTRCGKVKEYRR